MRSRARSFSLMRASRASADGRWSVIGAHLSQRRPLVEREVQQQHVDHRFAEDAELAALGVRVHQLPHVVLAQRPLARHARHLERGRRRADVRIEPGCPSVVTRSIGTGDARILGLEPRDVGRDPVDQLLVGRTEVRSRRGPGVVAAAGRRRPRVEVARRGERLADDARADDLAVALDQLAVGLVREQHLRQAGDDERIDEAQQHRGHHGHQKRRQDVSARCSMRSCPSTRGRAW